MDEKPFFEFSVNEIKDAEIDELKKFHKSYFNLESIFTTASELKYSSEIKNVLSREFKEPSEPFVRFFIGNVYDGKATAKVVSQFTEIVKKSINQLVSDMINDRLKSALAQEAELEKERVAQEDLKAVVDDRGIETTQEEIEGYLIVKSILRRKVDASRIVGRDTKTYFGILLDDNNRKPLCRLWFNGTKKYLGLFDQSKTETKHELQTLDEIFNYQDQLLISAECYEKSFAPDTSK